MDDDVAYNYSATMYLSAPINVQLPVFDPAAVAREEAAIAGIRSRFLFLHANSSVTEDDSDLDGQLTDLKNSWFNSWRWQSIRSAFGCHFPDDPFLNNSGCFSTYTVPFDFWGSDKSNNAWRFKFELDMLHSLAFKYVSADVQAVVSAEGIREFILNVLSTFVDRGLSKESWDPGILEKDWYVCSLYFTDKDGNYGVGWSQVPFYQRTESLLTKIVLLFRDSLKSRGIFDDIMGAVGTFTGRWAHGEKWLNEENFDKCFDYGMNTDMSRFVFTDRSVVPISCTHTQIERRTQKPTHAPTHTHTRAHTSA